MKKQDQKRLDAALDKALAPPKQRPKQNLDALLDEYDEEPAPPLSTTVNENSGIPASIPNTILTSIPDGIPSKTSRKKPIQVEEERFDSLETTAPLDATHTGSEKSVYSIMYRETISKGVVERHFGPAELMKKSGIRSRNTVHKALYGLLEKLSIEVIAETRGNPVGPRYRVYRPQEIERRRKVQGIKIDQQTKKITEHGTIPASIPESIPPAIAKNWDTTIPEIGTPTIPNIGTLYKREDNSYVESDSAPSSSSNVLGLSDARDDEAFASFAEAFRKAATEITGKSPSKADADRWREVADVLVAELKIAAARTTVSSVPSFLAEHLRRRLWKMDQRQARAEGRELPDEAKPPSEPTEQEKACPDCGGSGWFYPDGPERGVVKCRHAGTQNDRQTSDLNKVE